MLSLVAGARVSVRRESGRCNKLRLYHRQGCDGEQIRGTRRDVTSYVSTRTDGTMGSNGSPGTLCGLVGWGGSNSGGCKGYAINRSNFLSGCSARPVAAIASLHPGV